MKMYRLQQHTTSTLGFSLIEVLVSLSIFTIVITISVGSLMVLIDANVRAQNTQSVMTNISYALDSMTREMRTGSDYYCGAVADLPVTGESALDCANGGAGFSFNEGGQSLTGDTLNDSRRISYRLNGTTLERRLGNGDGDSNVNETEDWSDVTSPDIEVTEVRFYSTGTTRTDASSPTVTVYLKGVTGDDEIQSEFNIQTTVVQQLLDI